ncbi:DNA-binding transcriptional regulator, LysR family [Pasteurella testudinis DSM 23072]|uniref:DNA-binding transcriptional regulator, LysR family n=1 Tax=Pasteurella testudinis DSM 23072 TaxID=1122938 RepID=A0A1W1UQ96_9PAST|nr:LysR substrate-binding domain-containing protein [Pasteurella testudinis]SMB83236.1 DNA-binding transcriptional regulator, LysR family [Pasteurella testudinis DSM 23072]SUB50836.1 putative LysR transcriptional regulator, HTH domain profile [Pasteurella testudinis]
MQNRHNLELAWLKDCIALADKLNFSQAAALRYITQSAFSRRIQSLEEWVGTPLFIRNRRNVALTRAGEMFCKKAPDLIRAIEELRSEALDIAGAGQPDVVIAATHSLSFSFFPELLRRHDKLARFGSFRLLSDTFQAGESILQQGKAQFLLCHYHPAMQTSLDNARFSFICLGGERLIPYSKTADGSAEPVWKIASGAKIPYLSFSNESGMGRIVANAAALKRIKNTMTVIFTADLAATLLAMVKSGEGVAWLPESLVRQDIKDGNIVPAAEDSALWLPMQIRLYRANSHMPQAVETLWEIFMENQSAECCFQ